MSEYIINATNTTGESGTIVPDIEFYYTDYLNDVNNARLKFSGTGELTRTLLVIGSKIEIKRNGVRDFYGFIESFDTLDSGAIIANVRGYEIWLGKENGVYANSPYQNTASATINVEILAESNYFAAGTIEAGTNLDFRVSTGDSLWNGISNLRKKTTQDIGIDYPNLEIDILNHKGSSTSVLTLNDGISMRNVGVSETYPAGNKIRVYGKGDGVTQITATAEDATSISTYGAITRDVIDKSIISTAEAQLLADAELAISKDPTQVYNFNVVNPNQSIVSGDVITLNSTDKGLSNAEVRVVAIQRGVRGASEFLQVQVTNQAYSRLVKTKTQILSKIQKENRDLNTYMQGAINISEWTTTLNANNTTALEIRCPIKADMIQNEAGNLNFISFTVDYNLTEFNKQFGGATFDGSDPQVQNSSGYSAPTVAGTSGYTLPDIYNSSGYTQPTITGSSGLTAFGSAIGSNSNTGVTCNASTWTTVCTVSTAGSDDNLYCNFFIKGNSGGPEDITVKIDNSGVISSTDSEIGIYQDGFRDNTHIKFSAVGAGPDGSADTVDLKVYAHTGAIVVDGFLSVYKVSHTHNDGSYAAINHLHDDGDYKADNHLHDDGEYAAASHPHTQGNYDINAADLDHISITDEISTSPSVNASNVVIYLDFYNTGTSTWDNKHSITPDPASIFKTDIDITDSGTYPDAVGSWRVRIITNNANADLTHAVAKLKYPVDN